VFVLAHLSDPHLAPLARPRLRELTSKRLLGYLNWRRGRHAVHRLEPLEAIVRDIRRQHPDHVAVTGDLVNVGLPSEFERARHWLETLGAPGDVSLVPGNHDAYVRAAGPHRNRHWAIYMAGDEHSPTAGRDSFERQRGATQLFDADAARFPYVRRRGPVALVGLSTAVPTSLFMATGRLGAPQIARAAAILAELREKGLFRVVMLHHPPYGPRSSAHKRLIDAAALRRAIAAVGAELLIHGHDHVHALAWLPGYRGRVPVIGVPSASAVAGMRHHAAAYNLYRIGGGPGAWTCQVDSRGLRVSGAIAELNRLDLSWGERV